MSPLPDDSLEVLLRRKLLTRTREDVDAMRSALQSAEFPLVVRLAHRLAGAAGALGLEALSHAARELQRVGERGEAPLVQARLEAVVAELDRVAAPRAC